MKTVGDDLVAVTPARAAAIAQATERQVDYWARTGVAGPSLVREISPRNRVRLYDLSDLVELYVVAQLLRQGVALPQVRAVLTHLRQVEGYAHPLRELRFATAGRDVYFQREDGTWSGGLVPGQVIFPQVLPLEEVRRYARAAATRREHEDRGRITSRRGVHAARPVLAGTRAPVSAVRAYLDRGYDDAQILAAYPQLSPLDIEAVRQATVAAS